MVLTHVMVLIPVMVLTVNPYYGVILSFGVGLCYAVTLFLVLSHIMMLYVNP